MIRLREKNAESAERMRMMKLFRQEKDLELMNLAYRLRYDSVRVCSHYAPASGGYSDEGMTSSNRSSLICPPLQIPIGTRIAGPWSYGGYSARAEPGGTRG